MGKKIDNPRYNIISVRVSDADYAELEAISNGRDRSALLRLALEQLIISERQLQLDEYLRARGL